MNNDVRFCPFCGQEELDTVAKQTIKTSEDSLDLDEVIYTYCCAECGGMFQSSKYVDEYEEEDFFKFKCFEETSEDSKACTDDCIGPASEWFEQKYYETLRELEKTKYLLDLTVKEGMRRE